MRSINPFNRRRVRSLIAATVTAAGISALLVGASAYPGGATKKPLSDTLTQTEAASPHSAKDAPANVMLSADRDGYVASLPRADVDVMVSTDPAVGVAISRDGADLVKVELPNAAKAEDGVLDENGLVTTTTGTAPPRSLSFVKAVKFRLRL